MHKRLRVLDIDVECLPGHWIAADYVSKIITAVAWKPVGSREPVTVLTHYDTEPGEMALQLAGAIEEADVVAGHYIRGFDLPLLNGNLLRAGAPPLQPLMAHDTKLDLVKSHGRSLSQKNLSAQIGVRKPKIDVTLFEWEAFNTRTPGFRDAGINRVRGDVLQNIEMRSRLIEMGWLGPPKRWDGAIRGSRYQA